jgi:hypothetical protein
MLLNYISFKWLTKTDGLDGDERYYLLFFLPLHWVTLLVNQYLPNNLFFIGMYESSMHILDCSLFLFINIIMPNIKNNKNLYLIPSPLQSKHLFLFLFL